jgi:hypothetical protein
VYNDPFSIYIHIYISAALSDQSCATCMAYEANRMVTLIGKEDQPNTPLGVFDDECLLHHTVRYVRIRRKEKKDRWAWIRSQLADILPSAKTKAVKA